MHFLLVISILAMAVTTSHGCLCGEKPNMTQLYCEADFLIRATVMYRSEPFLPNGGPWNLSPEQRQQRLENYGVYIYRLGIIDIIRFTEKYLNTSMITMQSYRGTPFTCGVTLEVGTTYILNGKVADFPIKNVMSTSMCNYPEVISYIEPLPSELSNLNCDGVSGVSDKVVPPPDASGTRDVRKNAAIQNMKRKKMNIMNSNKSSGKRLSLFELLTNPVLKSK